MNRLGSTIKAGLLQVHSIAGLVLALLLCLIALTGVIMSFEDEIVDHLNSDIMQVAPRTTPALLPDELVARLKSVRDAGKVTAITLSSDPSAAVHIRFARDEQGARPSSFYVDPYDGSGVAYQGTLTVLMRPAQVQVGASEPAGGNVLF